MRAILGQYHYAPHRRLWGVWVWTSVSEHGASGTFVKDFMNKDENYALDITHNISVGYENKKKRENLKILPRK